MFEVSTMLIIWLSVLFYRRVIGLWECIQETNRPSPDAVLTSHESNRMQMRKNPLFSFISIRFGSCEAWRLNLAFFQRRVEKHHVTILYQSDSSLNLLMADSENLPKARVVAVIFGFPSFVFNELSWNPSQ